jgi:hypothetical protein
MTRIMGSVPDLRHQDAARLAKPRLGIGNRARHSSSGQCLVRIAHAHVLQKLRHRVEGAERPRLPGGGS